MSRWQRLSQALERSSWALQQMRGAKSSPTKLPVELLEDIPNLGAIGTVSKVNHGYARNYLLPHRLAAVRRGKQSGSVEGVDEGTSSAAIAAKAQLHSEEEQRRFAAAQQRKKLEAVVKKLTTVPLVLRRKASESGKLETPVSAQDVVDAVARSFQIEMVPQLLDIGNEVLSATGEYQLPLRLVLPGGARAQLEVKILST